MRILVTGGTGFVGFRLVTHLLENGHAVRVLVRDRAMAKERMGQYGNHAELVRGSVIDLDSVRSATKGVNWVVHLAAMGSPSIHSSRVSEMIQVNAGGTANTLIASGDSGVEKFILASSAAVYGSRAVSPCRESALSEPSSAYGVSKVAAEDLCGIYGQQFGFATISLRFFNIYGPGQDQTQRASMVIPRFIRAMLLGETITLFGGGRQLRDFVYIDDAIASIVAAAKGRLSGSHCFNVGSGIPVSIRRVVEMIADTTGSTYSSSSRQLGGGDVLESYADVSLIKKVLGWEAIVKIEDGIQRTIAAGVDSGL